MAAGTNGGGGGIGLATVVRTSGEKALSLAGTTLSVARARAVA
jgi:hypothetical protein